MKVYVQLREGFNMFCLSPDDREAYDVVMAALDAYPVEMRRALTERGLPDLA